MTNPMRIPLPTCAGGWRCVTADPPWPFRDKGSRIAPDQRQKLAARKGYETLGIEQLLHMPVAGIVADDAFLFLWTTSAHLLDGSAARVAVAWGFEPKTTIVWVKTGSEATRVDFSDQGCLRATGLVFGDGALRARRARDRCRRSARPCSRASPRRSERLVRSPRPPLSEARRVPAPR